jgi:hypothetical protein
VCLGVQRQDVKTAVAAQPDLWRQTRPTSTGKYASLTSKANALGVGGAAQNLKESMNNLNGIFGLRAKLLREYGYSSYQEYLASDEWKTIKAAIKLRRGRKWNFCNICDGD